MPPRRRFNPSFELGAGPTNGPNQNDPLSPKTVVLTISASALRKLE